MVMKPRAPRARFAPMAVGASVLVSAVLGLSATGTLSSFTASVTNGGNTAASGSLVMEETDSAGNTACVSSSAANNANASCSTIDTYGGTTNALTPGAANTTTIRLYNTGTTPVDAFTLAPGTCSNSGPTSGDLCGEVTLTLTCARVTGGVAGTPVTLYNAVALDALTAKDIAAASSSCVPPASTRSGNFVQFVFVVRLAASADNTVQGQTVSQPLVWTYTGA